MRLSLYYSSRCADCANVRREAARLNLPVELRDVRKNPEYLEQLVAEMGRATVPVLRVEAEGQPSRWVPESIDIIEFLHDLRPQMPAMSVWQLHGLRYAPIPALVLAAALPTSFGRGCAWILAVGLFALRYWVPKRASEGKSISEGPRR